MARLKIGSKGQKLSEKSQSKPSPTRTTSKIPQRTLTLISITFLLNILLWSSLICFAVVLYQIVSDPTDITSISSEVLTLTSACVSISYTILHTIISLKQRIWTHQRRSQSTIKRTTYVAIRIVVTLCILWLLTSGWNMIMVARRPVCLVSGRDLQPWEYGPRCYVTRIGMAFAMLSLFASFTLFIMLATVGRPFEAHLFRCGQQNLTDSASNLSGSERSSPARTSEKQFRGRRMSSSTHQSIRSRFSDTDVETLDLNSSRPPSIHAPVPQRSFGMGIFTSDAAPPPIPVAYATPPRLSSLEPPPPIFHSSMSHQPLTRPPRLSGLNPAPFVPTSIAPQYAASTWRAVHPESLSSMRSVQRPESYRPGTALSYRSRYSRSSVSLTRPQRLSTSERAESLGWSSRSGSTGPDSQSSNQQEGEGRASTSDRSEASHGGRISRQSHRSGHKRVSSAPDTTSGAERSFPPRMAIGWKPHAITTDQSRDPLPVPQVPTNPTTRPPRSSSAHMLSRFSPDSSPDHLPTGGPALTSPKSPLHATSNYGRVMKELPFRRSRSMDPMQIAEANNAPRLSVAEAAAAMISRMPQDLKSPTRKLHSVPAERREEGGKGKVLYEEIKNKPLPKIAVL